MDKKESRWLISVTGICSLANGISYLFFTQASLAILGASTGAFGLMITRYYGACAIGWGLLLWMSRGSENTQVVKAILWSILVTLGFSGVIGFYGVLQGVFNWFGWLFVAIDIFLSLVSAFLLLKLWMGSRRR